MNFMGKSKKSPGVVSAPGGKNQEKRTVNRDFTPIKG
jgi:hypothetical protein